ncbi:MAG TPA: 3-oxoacyl-ACP reductase family protein [Xanthobacteraceae bacterium]
MATLAGRCALVTGGARGIGAAYALALAKEGAAVVISDILDTARAVEALQKIGAGAIGVTCDVADYDSCERMVAAGMKAFGRIDILVNNAAMFAAIQRKPFEQLSTDEWDRVMAVNVRGPFNAVKAVLPEMKRQKYGKIINVSSTTVFAGTPGMLHYVTSKGAVLAFTRALAREVAPHGILVNGIAPGLTMSEALIAQREILEPFAKVAMASRALKREQIPEDLTGTLVYLAGPASDFMTGQTLTVDGGYVMR